MKNIIFAAAVAAMLSACAEAPHRTAQIDPAFTGPGAETAANLGFHGPVERVFSRNGN